MSVLYTPVQWTNSKIFYDVVMVGLIFVYVMVYLRLAPEFLDHTRPVDGAIVNARAFGTCAFLMLTAILCIGPLARLDRRFLPLLYNRRHFGVMTFFVALTHAAFVLGWYFSFSPTPRFAALLGSNTSYDQFLGFPFETLGIFTLLVLAILAATSHDFWLNFLTPRVWKALHYLIYPAYAALVAHIGLGSLQSETNSTFAIVVGISVFAVSGLHLAAAMREGMVSRSRVSGEWLPAGTVSDFAEGHARITRLDGGQRVAIFLNEGRLSAISNACAHQNGPLGEGRIIDGCVTCPWHGFQYKVEDGRSPAPFTEMVPTYNLKVEDGQVFVRTTPNPPGTYVEPIAVSGAGS